MTASGSKDLHHRGTESTEDARRNAFENLAFEIPVRRRKMISSPFVLRVLGVSVVKEFEMSF